MEWLMSLDPATVQGWLGVAMALAALIGMYRQSTGKTRWERILSIVQPAHRLAQKAAALTRTQKDDEFLRIAARLLGAFGIKLDEAERETLRALGSAEHQTYKLLRDGGTGAPVLEAIPGEVAELLPPAPAPAPLTAPGASSLASEPSALPEE